MIPHYYEDPHTLHVGTMPNRAYYIPASRRSDALVEHRETSDRFQLLNGSWKFRYYASIYDLQDAFYEVGYDASAFDSIPVPSVWQNHGYDHHQYTNIRYPFPADPPYVPKENPCGAYLYDFTYQKDAAAPRAFLNFEGVASCFYVWLNGQFVGYSQVAHSTSEFDVTKFLQDGTNHLAVLVLKWCDGSYMEDQDMFRMNGIFRDVYLLHRPEQCIEDYFITTDIHGSTAGVAVRLRYYDSAVATRITLYDAAGTMHCDKNKLAKEFAAMYSDNEEQAAAVKEVDRAFARMETVTPKAVNPDEQSIIVVCKGFGDEGDDTVCIEVGDLRNWKEKHTKKSEPISDEMLTFMSTDEIENAVMNQDLPTKYAFELSAWDEILSWKLAPSSIYIYGLEFCLSRVLWEMTFFGVDESGVELEKEKLDTRFEEAQRFFDENKEPQIGFSIEDIAKKLLGDDYTEDWYPEEEQERDRRNMVISSYIASTTAALFWWVDG